MRHFPATSALLGLFLFLVCSLAHGAESEVLVLGKGVDRFELGATLFEEDFENLDQWVVQLQELQGVPDATVEVKEGSLDCVVPGRGCTVWFKQKLKTRLAITYEVVCPEPEEGTVEIEVKDVNNFWMASDPKDSEKGLFDSSRYNGDFTTYNKMNGYYASSGGGRNTTTRMRRYPREKDGRLIEHIALKDRDGKKDYLITPGKVMKVQLVAFDDLVQFIVDGKLVYEMAFGDEVEVERFRRGRRKDGLDDYDDDEFPFFKEGYFGFRMVGTHHIYSNFRVQELKEIVWEEREPTVLRVSSLDELREAAANTNQVVTMEPGVYRHRSNPKSRVAVLFSGSRNQFDFTGVTFEMPIEVLNEMAELKGRGSLRSYVVTGDEVVIKGGRFINTHPQPLKEGFDFGSYNQDPANYPADTVEEIYLRGKNVRLEGCYLELRGSSPFGYGNMYGIGGGAVVPLRKHNGILIHGDGAVLDDCHVKTEAFGHAIFAQYGDNIVVKNCLVEGQLRSSNDFLKEDGEGSLAKKFKHQIQWPDEVKGVPVPADHMINLSEDGIRAYAGTKKMTVENCKVVRMRAGIKLYLADEGIIRNCEVLDCVVQGYSVPSRGVIENCRGNAAYGPLLYVHMDSHNSQKIELEVIPAPHGIGDHPLAAIRGREHRISFFSNSDEGAQFQRPIIVGYPMRFDYLSVNYPEVPEGMESFLERFGPDDYKAERISLENETSYPVVLGEFSEKNRIRSKGPVTDLGKGNRVSNIE